MKYQLGYHNQELDIFEPKYTLMSNIITERHLDLMKQEQLVLYVETYAVESFTPEYEHYLDYKIEISSSILTYDKVIEDGQHYGLSLEI